MTKIPKRVASKSLTDVSAWNNSTLIGDPVAVAQAEEREVGVVGSLSVVRALHTADLVDEYRLMTFPTVVGSGERLFGDAGTPSHQELVSVEQVGVAVLSTYWRSEAGS